MKNVFSLKMLIGFFLVVYCIQNSALAQQNETEVIKAKVEKLKQKVAKLESRVAQLEKVLLSNENIRSSSQRIVNSDKWNNRQNWRKLERGMSKAEVKQILGEPDRIDAGSVTYWHYSDIFTSGDVTFMDGKVYGWSEP